MHTCTRAHTHAHTHTHTRTHTHARTYAHAHTHTHTQLTGFPIHFRYSDIHHILTTVEGTAVHLCEDEQVEYSLAVYVHPYPNDVLSVWLYIVSLVPK